MAHLRKVFFTSILSVFFISSLAGNDQKSEVPLQIGHYIRGTNKPSKAPGRIDTPLHVLYDPEEHLIEFISEEPILITYELIDDNDNVIQSSICLVDPDFSATFTLDSSLEGTYTISVSYDNIVLIGDINI